MNFFDESGFIVSYDGEKGSENSLLWMVQYYFLNICYNSNQNATYKIETKLDTFLNENEIIPGIYHDHPRWWTLSGKDQQMSHDQLTAIISYLYQQNEYEKVKDIWKQIVKQKFRYDNINPHCPSIMRQLHPRDILFYGYLAGNWICIMLFWLFGVISLVELLIKYKYRDNNKFIKTDNILLFFVKSQCCYTKQMLLLRKIYDKILHIRFGDKAWYEVFKIYFKTDDHPSVQLAKEIS